MIKTIEEQNIEEFDKKVNDFEKNHQVFATQTHITPIQTIGGVQVLYSAIIFYRPTTVTLK